MFIYQKRREHIKEKLHQELLYTTQYEFTRWWAHVQLVDFSWPLSLVRPPTARNHCRGQVTIVEAMLAYT
jgi:hypothetical protein